MGREGRAMRCPRLTVRWLMVAVAVVAVDFGLLIAAPYSNGFVGILVEELVVPVSLVIVSAAKVAIGLVKHGRASAFATGYLLTGGVAGFLVCSVLAVQEFWLIEWLPFLDVWSSAEPPPVSEECAL